MSSIEFCVFDAYANPYTGTGSGYIAYGSFIIANFETTSLISNGTTVHAQHYAVDTRLKGKGFGSLGALLFAEQVARKLPNVSLIEFDLSRQNPADNPMSLRLAREKVFESLGAAVITTLNPNKWDPPRWIVNVKWPKSNWHNPVLLRSEKNRFIELYEKDYQEKQAKGTLIQRLKNLLK